MRPAPVPAGSLLHTMTTCCCLVATSTGSVKIIERFSAFASISRPGMSCIIPCIDCVSGTVSMRLQQIEVACETKTKDNVFVVIRCAVQYKVLSEEEDIKNAYYRLTNPKQQIEAYVYDVVRATVPKIDLDDGAYPQATHSSPMIAHPPRHPWPPSPVAGRGHPHLLPPDPQAHPLRRPSDLVDPAA